ncbi:CapA family protein [Streptococcus pacificus]|uniref:CapA family protein n=1 Tax=Streptococcus pacificus TaxID=2740577 RepID=A0ABS0ZHF7_9STRE|nr:CapA family protein [Streptococcus pacificus]MBJ8325424.1 CapA family protein [Streptococcus pacificus]
MFKLKRETLLLLLSVILLLVITFLGVLLNRSQLTSPKPVPEAAKKTDNSVKTARVVANGDILLHDILYTSAKKADGSYDFTPYFEYAKDWIDDADLAIGDYEGTISPDFPLAGYPLFNAPSEIAENLKSVGYDVVDLAHNHILDSQLAGALNTVDVFQDQGIDTVGVYKTNREKEPFLIKEVNGIKIAILAYAYGYNGMEANLTQEEYEKHLSDLDEEKIQAEIEEAEKKADVTIVMPQMGVEYQREPTQEQIDLYHKMIDWGADVVFGGHPHVTEPSEVLEKEGENKLIIYSMGNFISNQRLETVDDIWTERGVLMDVTFEKKGDKTVIKTAKAHPTQVWSWGKGEYGIEGYEYRDYRVLILEDFIAGGKNRDTIDDTMKEKVDIAYKEMNELVDLKWPSN